MAGIGIELNKIFARKSLISYLGGYTAAAMIFTGPVVLGIILLVFVHLLSSFGGASPVAKDIIVVIITYSLIASMVLNNIFATTVTRYIADLLYTNKTKRIMPALHGAILVQLVLSIIIWGPFMIFCGAGPLYSILGFIFFCELGVVWTLISFISAVKDYVRIIAVFAAGVGAAILFGFLLVYFTHMDVIVSLLIAVYLGYGVMALGYFDALKRYFPESEGGLFRFVEYFFLYPQLSLIGMCLSIGLFSHFVVVWYGPYGMQNIGLFRSAPLYDVPALFAFLTTLLTTISFSTTTEVNFYPAYKNYYDLLNTNGSLQAINIAERDMLIILRRELLYLAFKQFLITLLFCTIGSTLLAEIGVGGLNTTSLGLFRELSVGYGIFASANGILLVLFYFANYRIALLSVSFFAAGTLGFSLFFTLTKANISSLGFSISAGAIVMYIVALFSLWNYTNKLQYNIFSKQPLLAEVHHGPLYHRFKRLWSDP